MSFMLLVTVFWLQFRCIVHTGNRETHTLLTLIL